MSTNLLCVFHDGVLYRFKDREKYDRAIENLQKIEDEFDPIEAGDRRLLREMGTGPAAFKLPVQHHR